MPVVIEPVLLDGLMPEWGDSLAAVALDGKIHVVGQARRAIYPSTKHYVFSPNAVMLADIDWPFPGNAELIIAAKGDDFYTWCGTTDYAVRKFSPAGGLNAGGWSTISADTSPEIGQSPMGSGGYCPLADMFYRFGGFTGTNFWRSPSMLDGFWEDMGPMPASIQKLSAAAWCYHDGKFVIIGGANNLATGDTTALYDAPVDGEVWVYDTLSNDWALQHTDKLLFGSIWCDCAPLVVDGVFIGIVYSRGLISGPQLATFDSGDVNVHVRLANNRGIYISAGWNLESWTRLDDPDSIDLVAFETHRRAMVELGNYVYMLAGYNDNGMLRVRYIPPTQYTGLYTVSSGAYGGPITNNGDGMRDGIYNIGSSCHGSLDTADPWIQADLGASKIVEHVEVACILTSFGGWGPTYLNNARIETSVDAVTWTDRGMISGVVDGVPQHYQLGNVTARYVRIRNYAQYLGLGDFKIGYSEP